jgi:hypothetical protein
MPMRIFALVFLSIPLGQLPKIFVILVVGGISYVAYTTRHTNLAKGQELKR